VRQGDLGAGDDQAPLTMQGRSIGDTECAAQVGEKRSVGVHVHRG